MSESLSSIPSSRITQEVEQNTAPAKRVGKMDTLTQVTLGLGVCIGIALIVIGALALTGHLSGIVAGGCAVGLGGLAFVLNLIHAIKTDDPKQRAGAIVSAILNLALIIIGSLAITGILSGAAVGWAIIGPMIASLALGCITSSIACCAGVALGASAYSSAQDGTV